MTVYKLTGEEEMMEFAARLSQFMRPGSIVLLEGPLGSGKTTFVRGLAKGLGLSQDYDIVSPTFTLLNIYPASIPLYHADCYRASIDDLFEMDLISQASDGVLAVEWPKQEDLCSSDANCWHVHIEYEGSDQRLLKLKAPLGLRDKIKFLLG